MRRLSRSVLSELPPSVRQPHYDRENLKIGMAHIGVGAFHRCHQEEFVDDMLEARFGRWGVLGVNLTAPSLADLLAPQDCLYSRMLTQDARVRDPHHRRASRGDRRYEQRRAPRPRSARLAALTFPSRRSP